MNSLRISIRPPRWGASTWVILLAWAVWLSADDFLFTSFRGNGEDGLHLAWSPDGYRWTALNQDRSFLRPEIGAEPLMRDPCLVRGPEGTYHLVWTTSWTADKGKVIGYTSSRDLLRWSPQRAIPLMRNEPETRNLWAPEIFYDRTRSRWLLFWSSTIPGRFPETDQTGDDRYNHRVYATTTTDFNTFAPCRLFFDPGFNVIDATLLGAEGKYHLLFKDERKSPLKKQLLRAVADDPEGPFIPVNGPFTTHWVEGPSAIQIKGEYLVYFDHYSGRHYYGAVRSRDLVRWEDCSASMVFPPGHRHGSVLRVPRRIAQALINARIDVSQPQRSSHPNAAPSRTTWFNPSQEK